MATCPTPSSLASLTGHLAPPPPRLDPLVERLSDDALELFYARALHTMVRDTLRPSISRVRASAKVPMHKVAMQMQMGRPVDDSQEKALARAWDRSGGLRWDGLLHGATAAARAPYWNDAMHLLTDVRNEVHSARNGPANPNVQPLLNLLDVWHNLPILMVQKGVRAIDPKRVGTDGVLERALLRYAQAAVEQEAATLRVEADQNGPTDEPSSLTRRRTP